MRRKRAENDASSERRDEIDSTDDRPAFAVEREPCGTISRKEFHMLVLSRKKGESVVVGGNITIVVVDVRGDKARLGIEAPADVAVYRSEVLEKNAASDGSSRSKRAVEPKRPKSKAQSAKADASVETLCLSNASEAYRSGDSSERSADELANGANATDEVKSAENAE